MDPNANLKATRKLTAALIKALDDSKCIDTHDVDRLCELVTGLDQWIMKGGFLPGDWQNASKKL